MAAAEASLQPVNESDCQYWSHYNRDTGKCECGSDLFSIVKCKTVEGSNTEVNISVIYGYCITLNKGQTRAVVGACPYHHQHCPPRCLYHLLYKNITAIMCGHTNRAGQLCGQCLDGYSPPVYSYYAECVSCSPGTNNWPKLLALSLLPAIPFLLATAVFRFNALSPYMTGYVFASQIFTSPVVVRALIHNHKRELHNVGQLTFFLAMSGIWNLDGLKVLFSPFCLHPRATTLQVLSLDYLTAVYPLLLIILCYTLVRLHYNNCRLVVLLWRPFIPCFARYRRQWDIQNSLVDAFATFLLLSYVKVSSVSLDLLTPTILWNSAGRGYGSALYYDGTVNYFSKAHLPYVILAITVLSVFSISPIILLCLYPCGCCQRALNRLQWNSTALHFFMNSFQGCFKDGTNGTRDCRWFSSLYLLSRLALHIGFIVCNNSFSTFVLTVILLGMIVLLASVQPYKNPRYTKVDIAFISITCLFANSAWELHGRSVHSLSSQVDRMYFLFAPVVIFYPFFLLFLYIFRVSSKQRMRCLGWLRKCYSRRTSRENGVLN